MKNVYWTFMLLILGSNAFAGESSLYDFSWLDRDKEVYVLQNRKFRKKNSVYIGGALGITTSGTFTDAKSFQGRAGYFFKEDWGIELVFARNTASTNATFNNLRDASIDAFYREVTGYTGGMLMWSPFYSKINTFNKVMYFDLIFGLGFATIETEDNRCDFLVPSCTSPAPIGSSTGLMWDVGTRVYMSQSWSMRIDLTGIYYTGEYLQPSAPYTVKDQSFKNIDFTIGMNYAF